MSPGPSQSHPELPGLSAESATARQPVTPQWIDRAMKCIANGYRKKTTAMPQNRNTREATPPCIGLPLTRPGNSSIVKAALNMEKNRAYIEA